MKTSIFIACFWLALGYLALGYVVSCADAQTLRTVSLSETQAPGMDSGVEFSGFSLIPALNNAGQTTFRGFLAGPGVDFSSNVSVWSEGGDAGLALVAREGSPAPGVTNDEIFSGSFNEPSINNAGQIAVRGGLTGTGVSNSNDRGLWSQGGGAGLALVARDGNLAPGTVDNENFSFLGPPAFNGAGQSAFLGLLPTGLGSNNSGIWSEGGGAGLALVARGGNQAPGVAAGVNFGTFRDPVINGAGQTAFWAFLTGPGVGDHSVWSEGGGAGLALVARQGDSAPGTAGAANFSSFDKPVINNAGQTAFSALLEGAESGIWSEGAGSGLALVARSGDLAPDVIDGANFSGFSEPVLNGAGRTAFRADLTGAGVDSSNDRGIWSEGEGAGLALVARSGNSAPGVSGDVTFSDFSNPTLNGAGRLAFRGTLTGTDVNNGNDRGLWAEDSSGALTLIAREGDMIDLDDGSGPDLRTIAALSLAGESGNEDGRRSEFNDLGQLAFMIQFTDSSEGIFVSDLVATSPGVAGDFDDDNDVDGADFLKWQRGESLNELSAADLADWETNFGTTANSLAVSPTAVPEPGTLLLGALTAMGLLLKRINKATSAA